MNDAWLMIVRTIRGWARLFPPDEMTGKGRGLNMWWEQILIESDVTPTAIEWTFVKQENMLKSQKFRNKVSSKGLPIDGRQET